MKTLIRTGVLLFFFILLSCQGSSGPSTADSLKEYERLEISENKSMILSFVGDIMAHTPNHRTPNFNEIYTGVRDILILDDLSFANLEFPIDNDRPMRTYPQFNMPSTYVEAAIDSGFDVFSLANNHTNDWGESSVKISLKNMEVLQSQYSQENREIVFSGVRDETEHLAYKSEESDYGDYFHMEIIERDGFEIGFISITGIINSYAGVSRVYMVSEWDDGTAYDTFINWIKTQRPLVDALIVSYHGGIEYRSDPNSKKQEFFHRLIDAGVDIVWGHHPHVLQPYERILRSDGRWALIMYSVGNFVSGQTWFLDENDFEKPRARTGDSAIVQANLIKTGDGVSVLAPRTILISHEKVDNTWVRIRTFDDILEDDESAWFDFYTHRYAVSSAHMKINRSIHLNFIEDLRTIDYQ